MSRIYAYLLSAGMIGATLSPIAQNFSDERHDDFPLSYYPMFTQDRGETARVTYAFGLDDVGNRRVIPYRYIFSGGMNQARKQLRITVRESRSRTRRLCRQIASRIADRREYEDLHQVMIATGRYRFDDYFRRLPALVSEEVHVDCLVWR